MKLALTLSLLCFAFTVIGCDSGPRKVTDGVDAKAIQDYETLVKEQQKAMAGEEGR